MAFVPETFILYPEKLNFAPDKAAYTYMKRYIFSLYICVTGCLAAMATQRFDSLSSPKTGNPSRVVDHVQQFGLAEKQSGLPGRHQGTTG